MPLLPINQFVLTQPIVNSIKQYGGDMNSTSKKILNDGSLPLSRMDTMMPAFENGQFSTGESIRPIKIRFRSDGYYTIIDGRHRFVAAVVLKKTDINCVFC